jgi:predicted transcriptional regulator YdeE
MSQLSLEPQIIEFGPYRVIGIARVAKGGPDCKAAWDAPDGFLAHMDEITTECEGFSVGICRCLPGVTDGSFEYIAARPVQLQATIPDGMAEVQLGGGTYLVFPVASLTEISQAWPYAISWLESHPEWTPFCGKEGCDCAHYPSFELYPPEFDGNGPLYLYFPVRKSADR